MIIVIGKSGQLAQACAEQFSQSGMEYTCFGRDDIDVLDEANIAERLNACGDITAIINAAAYTAVDNAETEYDAAFALNATAVENLVRYAKSIDAYLLHVSTDYVFSGQSNSPYLPHENYAPVNAYGRSKMAGEQIITEAYPENSAIIRTSWVYSEFGHNFVKTMLRLFEQRDSLSIIVDQVGAPTSAHTLASVCINCAQHKITGIHHATDLGVTSWFDFANVIYRQAKSLGITTTEVAFTPILTTEYPTPAKRPHYSVLDTSSMRAALQGVTLPYWQDALAHVMNRIKREEK